MFWSILFFKIGMADIHDVEYEIGFADFVQRGLEGLDEAVRQFADEADGVGEQEWQVFDDHFADSGVQSGKEFVFGEDIGLADEIHQGGLAHVGIADKGYSDELTTVAALRLLLAINIL